MFEKEAEEYAEKTSSLAVKKFNPLEPKLLSIGFQDGAEFGYNKANEWHKQEVDDIYDLISEGWSVRYFICIMKDKS